MKIGVDLRVLQVGHQYRGIGELTRQCLNRLFVLAQDDVTNQPTFVFYEYNDDIDPKKFLTIPKDLVYQEVFLGARPNAEVKRSVRQKLSRRWRATFGSPVPQAGQCDVFLQFSFDLGVPLHPRTVMVAHDLIPYIFWSDYFESPWLHVRHRAARTALRTMLNNAEYKRVLERSHRNAWMILAVSDHTRKDLQKYLHVPQSKIRVMPFGLDNLALSAPGEPDKAQMPTKPFLFYVGGIDARRRRVDDLVAAFNNLKAQGHDIQLVLVGENFKDPASIPNAIVRQAVQSSSYKDDIICAGYVDDATKHELYRRAIAFVIPSTYEGIGITVLEAMLRDCPVVTYKNSSIPEAAGSYPFYAHDWLDIWRQVEKIMALSPAERKKVTAAAKKHAEQFRWENTAAIMYQTIMQANA